MINGLVFYVPETVPDVSVHRHSSGSLSVAPKFLRVRQSADAQNLGRAEVWLPLSHLPWYRIHFLTVGKFYQREKEGSLPVTEYDLATEAGYTTRDQTFKVVELGCRLMYCFGISVTSGSCCAMRSAIEQSAQSITR